MPAYPRLWMRLDLASSVVPAPTAPVNVDASEARALAELMLVAYRGTADDEGEDLDDAIGEVERTLAGAYGPLIPEASFVVVDSDRTVGAILVTLFEDRPIVAHIIVDPSKKRSGIGTDLMLAAANALASGDHATLDLYVTEANEPAVRFYRTFGFRTIRRLTTPPAGAG